jgi:hypothetical protein
MTKTYATLTNRYTDKSTKVQLKVSLSGLVYTSSRQYNAAIRRISAGPNTPIRSNEDFMVLTDAGREYAFVTAEYRNPDQL